jgi:hypothetical protein
MPLYSADRVVELAALAKVAGMVGGAVAGATAGWMSKRNPILALCSGMVGIIGGLWIGSLMGMFYAGAADGGMIVACAGSLCPAVVAGLAGALPTSVLVGGVITLLALRHVRVRPPPYRTGFKAFGYGLLAGVLSAVAWVFL